MATGKKVKAVKAPSFEVALSVESIGQFIKARRTQEGLSTQDAAMLSGVSAHTLNNVENGIPGMKMQTVLTICESLGIKLQIVPWEEKL